MRVVRLYGNVLHNLTKANNISATKNTLTISYPLSNNFTGGTVWQSDSQEYKVTGIDAAKELVDIEKDLQKYYLRK